MFISEAEPHSLPKWGIRDVAEELTLGFHSLSGLLGVTDAKEKLCTVIAKP